MGLSVGIVGWGNIARRHASILRRAGADLRGVVSRRPDPAPGIERFETIAALLPHVDALTIAVPNHMHARLCLAAVRAGRAVLVEKPLLISEAELAALEAALPEAEMPVYVCYRLRWNPLLVRLRDSLRQPTRIDCSFQLGIEHLAAGKNWTREAQQTGGTFFTIGCHMLDLARWLAHGGEQPLLGLTAHARGNGHGADYPLQATLAGRLGDEIAITAAADSRGWLPYRIEVRVEHADSFSPATVRLDATHEPAEYEAMIHDFVAAAAARKVDRVSMNETLQLHRDLLRARSIAALHTRAGSTAQPGAVST